MENKFVFVNRRKGLDRRQEKDPCRDMSIDLYHRKRRKSQERRDTTRTLTDDYYAYMHEVMKKIQGQESTTEIPARSAKNKTSAY